jgi:hypothetical protein
VVRPAADYGGRTGVARALISYMPERHFSEPWSVEELDACFVVKDLNGQALAYMYFEKEPRHRHRRSELLTRDEARRICGHFCQAARVAKAVMTHRR